MKDGKRRSLKLPSLVRALLVMSVVVVVVVAGLSWLRWYQRESEREQVLAEIQTALKSGGMGAAFHKKLMPLTSFPLYDRTQIKPVTNPLRDCRWFVYLKRANFDWYVILEHGRHTKKRWGEGIRPAIVGTSTFRIRPPSKNYLPNETRDWPYHPSNKAPKHEWHYVLDFAYRLSAKEPVSEFDPVWIHSSLGNYKPDPDYDFSTLKE